MCEVVVYMFLLFVNLCILQMVVAKMKTDSEVSVFYLLLDSVSK